jgi:hypothetical protein
MRDFSGTLRATSAAAIVCASFLMTIGSALASTLGLGQPFTGSDAVSFQVPGQPHQGVTFDEGDLEYTPAPFLTRTIPAQGLQDTILRLVEPNTSLSDILAMKVTNLAGQQQFSLSFWSSGASITDSAFLTLAGINPATARTVQLTETNVFQDVNSIMFPSGSPLAELRVVSDPGGGGGGITLPGDSDFVSLGRAGRGNQFVSWDDPSAVPEHVINMFANGDPFGFSGPYQFTVQPTDALIDFSEVLQGENPPDPTADPSDELTMKIIGNCTAAPGCTLSLGFWSESTLSLADFRAAQNLNNPRTFGFRESGHPDVITSLFAELIASGNPVPFTSFVTDSDPPVPTPEPSTAFLLLGALGVIGYLKKW